MFEYYDSSDPTGDSKSIKSVNNPVQIFQRGQVWKDRHLLYSTVKVHTALTVWKPTTKGKTYIRC